jgi:hypothetical protein
VSNDGSRSLFARRNTLSFFDDLEFDDGPATEPQERSGKRGRGPRLPRRGPGEPRKPGQGPQLQRLLPAIAIVIVVIIVGVFLFRGCQEDAQKRAYRNYVDDVNGVVSQSNKIGDELSNAFLLNDEQKLISTVAALEKRQDDVTASTAEISGTGAVKSFQPYLVQTMQVRSRGLDALTKALTKALQGERVTAANATTVSKSYTRLIASDVIYKDFFQDPAQTTLNDVVDDAEIINSVFAKNPEYAFPEEVTTSLERIKGAGGTTSGNDCSANAPKGTTIDKVVAQPGDIRLVPGQVVTVPANINGNEFVVSVKNTGDCQLTLLKVKLTVTGKPTVVKEIPKLDAGQTVAVTFPAPEATASGVIDVKVTVEPVENESNASNNTFNYKVEYSLSGT